MKKTNVWSRKANEIFKAANLDLTAKGNEWMGCIEVIGDKGLMVAAEVLLSSNGFQTWMDGTRTVYAQK